MAISSRALALALLSGLTLATPVVAHASQGSRLGMDTTPLSAPSPMQQLDQATAEVRRGDLQRADRDLMVLQDRLINDSVAWNTPANENTRSMREAVTPLDAARAALQHGDTNAALSAIATARSML